MGALLRYNYGTHRAGATRLFSGLPPFVNVLYEDSGAFKVATVLADGDSTLQVEAPHGKRAKIKSKDVLLRFPEPGALELLAQAEAMAGGIEADFLRPCAFGRGGSRNSGETAFGADVFLPQGQGAISGRATRDAAGGACRHRKEETTARTGFRLGKRARARRVSG